MTYSIVARDRQTGCTGVAVQSCVLAMGTRGPVVRSGVGAAIAQAKSETAWGSVLLYMVERGLSADGGLAALTASQPVGNAQFAVVNAAGHAAAFTGPDCEREAGHLTGDGVAVQANTVASPSVWPAMLTAYEQSAEGLAGRLVAGLEAAELEGGDVRGSQSAALLIAGPHYGQVLTGDADDRCVDLRVDDSRDPVRDLRRLIRLRDAQRHLIRVSTAGDEPEFIESEVRAAARKAPDDPLTLSYAALRLGLYGYRSEAFDLISAVVRLSPRSSRGLRQRLQQAHEEGNAHAAVLLSHLEQQDHLTPYEQPT